MKIEIDINGVHRDEIEELKKYLEENCWKWQASSLTTSPGDDRINLERNNYEVRKTKKENN